MGLFLNYTIEKAVHIIVRVYIHIHWLTNNQTVRSPTTYSRVTYYSHAPLRFNEKSEYYMLNV